MLDVLFAAESLVPPLGGAERAALDALEHLARRGDRVRALTLPARHPGEGTRHPRIDVHTVAAPPGSQAWRWPDRRRRAEALGAAVGEELATRRADVVITQLTAAPSVVAAGAAAGVPSLLCLHGWESLCHWRFMPGSGCRPRTRCRGCPRTLALPAHDRADRIWFADAHAASLRQATALVAPGRGIASAVRRSCGRLPLVVAPVGPPPSPARPDRDGPVLAVSSLWTTDKGAGLLAPVAERIAPRELLVQAGDAGAICPLPALPANARVGDRPAELAELLGGCALVIVPSKLPEPFGRVAYEAMAAGVPVLASATGGLREQVPAAQRVAAYDDPDAWASAIARTLEPQAWERARSAGRAAASAVTATRPLETFAALIGSLATGTRATESSAAARPSTNAAVVKRAAEAL